MLGTFSTREDSYNCPRCKRPVNDTYTAAEIPAGSTETKIVRPFRAHTEKEISEPQPLNKEHKEICRTARISPSHAHGHSPPADSPYTAIQGFYHIPALTPRGLPVSVSSAARLTAAGRGSDGGFYTHRERLPSQRLPLRPFRAVRQNLYAVLEKNLARTRIRHGSIRGTVSRNCRKQQ